MRMSHEFAIHGGSALSSANVTYYGDLICVPLSCTFHTILSKYSSLSLTLDSVIPRVWQPKWRTYWNWCLLMKQCDSFRTTLMHNWSLSQFFNQRILFESIGNFLPIGNNWTQDIWCSKSAERAHVSFDSTNSHWQHFRGWLRHRWWQRWWKLQNGRRISPREITRWMSLGRKWKES